MTIGPALADSGVTAALLAAAVAVRQRNGSRAVGSRAVLLVAAGLAWEAGSLSASAALWHRSFLLHLVLLDPEGRLPTSSRRILVLAGYLLWMLPTAVPNAPISAGLGIALVVLSLQPHVCRAVPRPACSTAASPLLLAAALGWQPVAAGVAAWPEATLVLGYDGLLALIPAAVVVAATADRSRVERLVVDLGAALESDLLRGRLARALRDPTLVVGYWLPDRAVYVDDHGALVSHPPEPGPRSMTPITVDGRPVAVLLHDPAVSADVGVLTGVAAAAGWALENVRLREQVRRQVAVVDASRRRLITAGDEERRRLEEVLRTGPQRRLARAREVLAADAELAALIPSLDRAAADLVELATGLHPRVLSDGGLLPALSQLAELCPVPVVLHVPMLRLPEPTESALYFSCAEALTNVAKSAFAREVDVRLEVGLVEVVLVIQDDGVGGAQPGRSSGLRGLADRVEALGGHFALVSPAGGGTRLSVCLPLEFGAAV